MSFVINGDTYRNIQEQVQKNKEDIAQLKIDIGTHIYDSEGNIIYTINVDNEVTSDSDNLITSGAVADALIQREELSFDSISDLYNYIDENYNNILQLEITIPGSTYTADFSGIIIYPNSNITFLDDGSESLSAATYRGAISKIGNIYRIIAADRINETATIAIDSSTMTYVGKLNRKINNSYFEYLYYSATLNILDIVVYKT